MPNYRRHQSLQSGKRARGVRTLLITAIVIVGIFIGIRYLISGSGSSNNNTNEHEIQTLESLLENVNIPLDTEEDALAESKQTCDSVISSLPSEEKIVALTFDSINITDHASDILTTLKQNNVPAFFFLTGDFATDHADLVQSIAGNGFSIGNHSNTHRDFTTLETSDVASELNVAQDNLGVAGATPLRIARPPFNKVNDTVTRAMLSAGYCPVLWNIDSEDWKTESDAAHVIERVTVTLKPGGIIWMNYGHETAAEALPSLITKVREAGYTFVDLADYITVPETPSRSETNTNSSL